MKANEAPEKIYITNYNIPALPKDEQLSERWHEVRTQDTDIEYTRNDTFIEKAAEWLKLYVLNNDTIDIFEMEEQFKNYMKGE